MKTRDSSTSRRSFLKNALASTIGVAMTGGTASAFSQDSLQVWSCGGLAEAMIPANSLFEKKTGVKIAYTGAFAGALGKSLLGSGQTEVFAGRVLDLAKKLREAGKMEYFKPLCFTSYVMVTPKGNPAGIMAIEDMAKPGVRVVLTPEASPPGGQAVQALLKKAGVQEAVTKNAIIQGSCVQRTMDDVISAHGDVSIVELRITRMREFEGKLDIVPIPERFFPPPPLTFTVGVMKNARDRALADVYIDFITSAEGQAFFERQGFIPAISDKGRELVEKFGVKDV
ncbi:MAG: substrate-binding domain-containing protein [Syntrophobacteraceae bacterium]